jgi:hypothetical protein
LAVHQVAQVASADFPCRGWLKTDFALISIANIHPILKGKIHYLYRERSRFAVFTNRKIVEVPLVLGRAA